jgi:Type IV secretion system pilin
MKKIFRLFALLTSFGMPFMVAAQTGVNTTYLQNYTSAILGIVNAILVPVLMAIAFIVFLWGVYKYFILGAADEKSRTDGRQFTLWGVIGFVVILSLWGIVNIFMSTLGLSVGSAPPYPTIGNVGGSQNTTGANSIFGNPPGATIGGSSVTMTPAQTAALTQQYNSMQNVCGLGSTSADCQAAQAAYSASYYAVNPNPNATTQNAQNTTVGAGADCTYSPCAAGLTCGMSLGYPTCEAPASVYCPDGSVVYDVSKCPSSSGTGTGSFCLDAFDHEGTVDANGNCVAN